MTGRRLGAAAGCAVVLLVAGGCATEPPASTSSPEGSGSASGSGEARDTHRAPTAENPSRASTTATPAPGPLAGRVVVIDPGHQLGNGRFPAEINAPVEAGGFTKPCNTTGTATAGGYPEATFAWEVAVVARRLLEAQGARVLLTRDSNSAARWGPCVDERGRAGNPDQPGPPADLKVSLHADGSYAGRGFHVIAPPERAPWTDDIAAPSGHLARVLRDALVATGFPPSDYVGSDGIDVRSDLGTLNLADIPTVMAELGNMRSAEDAASMTSAAGRERYARAVVRAIKRYLRESSP